MNSIPITDSLTLRNVTLERAGNCVLDNVSLQLSERRIGLIGRNGSGKSSLVSLFNGMLKPTSGQVLINGVNVTDKGRDRRANVGYIFQNPDHQIIFPTVIEEIAFSLEMSGTERKDAKSIAAEYLTSLGASNLTHRPVHMLSEGQKQWLCIHAVLVTKPKVLVLDEPFSSLDLLNRYRLVKWISKFTQQIFLISHDLEVLSDFDRIIWLDSGQVHSDGKPSDVLPEYREDAWNSAGGIEF
ncbi:ABC transporter ATP-binding protein [Thalassospiraceae bacterium LMO-JJ14]|nr:ABC transporter ATP-binding protein [Thalassospiraceae bacterium LMO-JJ14]